MPRAKAIQSADVVFQGRVLNVYKDGNRIFANIAVIRPIKGSVRATVEVGTNASSAACGFGFRPGQVLIVGASLRQRQYSTSLRTMLSINRKN